MKLLSIFLISLLFIQSLDEAKSASGAANSLSQVISHVEKHKPGKIDCIKECKRRCGKSSRRNLCRRACRSCCAQCDCVPPGTYGNKAVCPCYANLKTHGNRPKCP